VIPTGRSHAKGEPCREERGQKPPEHKAEPVITVTEGEGLAVWEAGWGAWADGAATNDLWRSLFGFRGLGFLRSWIEGGNKRVSSNVENVETKREK